MVAQMECSQKKEEIIESEWREKWVEKSIVLMDSGPSFEHNFVPLSYTKPQCGLNEHILKGFVT